MKHVNKFEAFRKNKVNESVLPVNDIYKVKLIVDVPKSLINSYCKKVKDVTGNDLRNFYGDVDIAEELVKNIVSVNLDIDKIPANILVSGEPQAQPQAQLQAQPQAQLQAQEEPQEEPQTQGQAQPQGQTQAQPQSQAQPQVQVQTQVQTGNEELPL